MRALQIILGAMVSLILSAICSGSGNVSNSSMSRDIASPVDCVHNSLALEHEQEEEDGNSSPESDFGGGKRLHSHISQKDGRSDENHGDGDEYNYTTGHDSSDNDETRKRPRLHNFHKQDDSINRADDGNWDNRGDSNDDSYSFDDDDDWDGDESNSSNNDSSNNDSSSSDSDSSSDIENYLTLNDPQIESICEVANNHATEMFARLLKHFKSSNAHFEQLLMHHAIRNGNLRVVSMLIKVSEDSLHMKVGKHTLLCAAVKSNRYEIVDFLLQRGVDINQPSHSQATPLHIATRHNHLDVLALLLANKAHINAKDKCGRTALHYATGTADYAAAKLLLEGGSSIYERDDQGMIPLHMVAIYGGIEIAQLFIDRHCEALARSEENKNLDESIQSMQAYVDVFSRAGQTPLHLAALTGNVQIVRLLLDMEASVDLVASEGCSALHYATLNYPFREKDRYLNLITITEIEPVQPCKTASSDYLAIIGLLLERGANANQVDEHLQSPLHYAAKNGNVAVISLLLANGADASLEDDENRTPLHLAVFKSHLDAAMPLLERTANIESVARFGFAILCRSVDRGRIDLVRLLLSRGIDVNRIERASGKTPLHIAIAGNHLEAVTLLMKHGANVNAADTCGYTPLATAVQSLDFKTHKHIQRARQAIIAIFRNPEVAHSGSAVLRWTLLHLAVYDGDKDAVFLHLSRRDAVHSKGVLGMTPLHIAAIFHDDPDVVRLLLSHSKASVLVKDEMERTALHYAARYGHLGVVVALLDGNAEMDALDENGHSALHLAILHDHAKVVQGLLARGAYRKYLGKQKETLLHIAARNDCPMAVSILTNAINVNERDMNGLTAVHYAAFKNHNKVIAVLMDKGAGRQSNDLVFLFKIAANKGNVEFFAYFFGNGGRIYARKQS